MAKAPCGPTWALLSPSSLPSAEEVHKILGAIVPDYENPARNSIPANASKIIPKDWFAKPTEDGNFKVVLDRASGQKAYARLGDILKAAFSKNVSNNLHLTSTTVRNYAINQENQVFKLLKRTFKIEILDLIENAPPRSKGSVFAIVAIKTCHDAELSSEQSKDQKIKADAKAPIREVATAAGAPPLPVDPNLAVGFQIDDKSTTESSHIAKGERIFAVQYRIIKRRSEWRKIGRPKLPPDFEQKDLFVPTGPSMYGEAGQDDDLAEFDEEEEEEEGDAEGDDVLELGDLEHTWNLSSSNESELMTADPQISSPASSVKGVKLTTPAANVFLDAFASYRHSLHLPAHSVDLGVIEDAGYVAEQGGMQNHFDQRQWIGINEATLRKIFGCSSLQQTAPIHRASAAQLITGIPVPLPEDSELLCDARFAGLFTGGDVDAASKSGSDASKDMQTFFLLHQSGADAAAFMAAALEVVNKQFTRTLRLEEPMEPAKSLAAYGLDSLSAVEVRNWIRTEMGAAITLLEIVNASSLQVLCEKIVAKIPPATGTA
ncbi:hypothetical protein MMC11_002920 [Xylographa trunciseda]|nr:hypothetical protein [Xylographa trunciseda]